MIQRLGVAAALLGDPGVLLLDEPVNGLDPEGVVWIRTLLRSLAGEGRTVFVSSHLVSEMALTADHLIVIGRSRLIADTSVDQFVRTSSAGFVRVRSPQPDRLARLLHDHGATVDVDGDGTLVVRGVGNAAVGELAAGHGIVLHHDHDDSPHAVGADAGGRGTPGPVPAAHGRCRACGVDQAARFGPRTGRC
jgi:ABC-2 type transport system ATP-binding protein